MRRPQWLVNYEGSDVTADLVPMMTSVRYTDEVRRRSDGIELQLEDRARRWRGSWYPSSGHRIELSIGYEGEPLLGCGSFEVDEVSFDGPPDTVSISAMAAPISQALRSSRHRSWEGLTLREIVSQAADEYGLTVVGEPPDIRYERVTQWDESTLAFVRRLAEEHGFVASVRAEQLVFVALLELEAADVVTTLSPADLSSYSFGARTQGTYAACEVAYVDPSSRELQSARVELASGTDAHLAPASDVLRRRIRVETPEQAEIKARSLLDEANALRVTGSLELAGDPRLVAGANIELDGLDRLSGKYAITKSTHRLTRRSGYTTQIDIRRPSPPRSAAVMQQLEPIEITGDPNRTEV